MRESRGGGRLCDDACAARNGCSERIAAGRAAGVRCAHDAMRRSVTARDNASPASRANTRGAGNPASFLPSAARGAKKRLRDAGARW
jgi:hypothetical protein